MPSVLSRTARDLDGAARAALESLLGRRLDESEQVTVLAFPPQRAPSGKEREAAVRRLNEHLDCMVAKANGFPTSELEALLDDACEDVRQGAR